MGAASVCSTKSNSFHNKCKNLLHSESFGGNITRRGRERFGHTKKKAICFGDSADCRKQEAKVGILMGLSSKCNAILCIENINNAKTNGYLHSGRHIFKMLNKRSFPIRIESNNSLQSFLIASTH